MWDEAAEGDRSGSGSPMKSMRDWQSLHREYLDLLGRDLEAIVSGYGSTLRQFMADAQAALDGGEGFLFEDENYADFVEMIMSLTEFDAFHQMMIKVATKQRARGGGRPQQPARFGGK